MIQYFTGVPGSGKTYYATDYIYKNFTKDEIAKDIPKLRLLFINLYKFCLEHDFIFLKKYFRNLAIKSRVKEFKRSYDICHTNINEFKFDKLENVNQLHTIEFEDNLQILHKLYKSKVTDEELNEKAKEFGLYKALIVLDECHNLLDVKRPHLVWWLTYHRHMYQDIILITQSMSLVESKYKNLAEAWYMAKPKSLTISSKYFVYDRFINSRMFKNAKSGSIRVIKKKVVFALYQSGDVVNTSNILHKFIFIALGLAFALFIFFKYVGLGEFDKDAVSTTKDHIEHVEISTIDHAQIITEKIDNTKVSIDNMVYTFFYCDNNYCEVGDNNIPKRMYKKIMKHLIYEELGSSLVGLDMYKLHVLIQNDYLQYFDNKGTKTELTDTPLAMGVESTFF